MFDEFDEALRKLLIQEIPIRNNEVEIAFEQPKREWSARLNRPTLNVFLYDVRENTTLRSRTQRHSVDPARAEALIQRPESRVDLHYMITAWASEIDDEHRLLSRTMLGLLRHGTLPASLMTGSLSEQSRAILLAVSQYDHPLNPTEIWGVLDNELRPVLTLVATLTLNPYMPVLVPVVRTRELRVVDMQVQSMRWQRHAGGNGSGHRGVEAGDETDSTLNRLWTVGGVVDIGAAVEDARLVLVELERDVPIDAEGRFVIGNLRTGSYTLRLEVADREPVLRTIQVPSEEYDIRSEH